MKKSFQKQSFKALAKKVSTLSTTEKGQLRGGFSSVFLWLIFLVCSKTKV